MVDIALHDIAQTSLTSHLILTIPAKTRAGIRRMEKRGLKQMKAAIKLMPAPWSGESGHWPLLVTRVVPLMWAVQQPLAEALLHW